ncbi:hypothetical protein JKF63_00945 [Porcisia hertigi]|uniref:Uncharacterized protein n=1 Tax=Porcisia hertigi TaxID=2761500 RepID=A0A836L7G4_9TRYP|nr:hypothetical protein JKF63_00945 [Porcisia hertigi]
MATMLCASCQHSFPEDMLAPASFSNRVGRCLSRTTSLLSEIRGKTSKDDSRLSQLAQLLQELCGAVEEEVQGLHKRQNDPLVSPFSSSNAQKGPQQQQRKTRGGASRAVSFVPGGGRYRGSSGTDYSGTSDAASRVPSAGISSPSFVGLPTNSPRLMFEGTVPSYQLKRMITAFDLVSATLYSMLESLAVQCRARVALLWLRPRQNLSSTELVAPFVVGRELSALANSAPYCALELSIPCVVCQTGVALNLKPHQSVQPSLSVPLEDMMLTELIERTNTAQLLMPVFDRYTERSVATHPSTVMAVIHLIGSSTNPVPFHRHNEEAVAQTAMLYSSIISSYYETMIAEWTNRFYLPNKLHATAKYLARLDLRAEEKGMDDFPLQPQLIFRTVTCNANERTSTTEARDALKLLGQNALRRSAPLRPMATVKDLSRHATTLESYWVTAVEEATRLEKTVGKLEEGLLRHNVSAIQKMQEANRSRSTSRGTRSGFSVEAKNSVSLPPVAMETPATIKKSSLSSADINVSLTPPTPFVADMVNVVGTNPAHAALSALPSTEVLKTDEVEILEAVTLRRLRELGVDTSVFE